MKITFDSSHNPFRGYCSCSQCGVPLVHISDLPPGRSKDAWHQDAVIAIAKARGEADKADPNDFNSYVHKTPRAYYPIMAERAAEQMAQRVTHQLFCPYCGAALQQPRLSQATGKPVLPGVYGNTFKAIAKWAQELGIDGLLVHDYFAYESLRQAQEQGAKPVWSWYQ